MKQLKTKNGVFIIRATAKCARSGKSAQIY